MPATRRTSASAASAAAASRSARTPRGALELAPLDLGVEAVELDLLRLVLLEAVHADDDPLALSTCRA